MPNFTGKTAFSPFRAQICSVSLRVDDLEPDKRCSPMIRIVDTHRGSSPCASMRPRYESLILYRDCPSAEKVMTSVAGSAVETYQTYQKLSRIRPIVGVVRSIDPCEAPVFPECLVSDEA